MKALSIKQPWAWAILRHGKDVENRTWRTHYRGRIAIHASGRLDDNAPRQVWDAVTSWDAFGDRCVLLGTVDLVDVVRGHTSDWAEPGAWHWVLANPRPLPKPIECKGALGLWTVPDHLTAAIQEGQRP